MRNALHTVMLTAACTCIVQGQQPGAMPHVQVEEVTIGKDQISRRSIGHMEAINSVDVKAAVEGFIQEPHFKEGDIVKAGDVLFTIDEVRYKALVQQAEAEVERIEAQIIYAKNRHARLERLAASKATSVEEAETALAKYEELQAAKAQAEANLDKARKDLEDCTIRAEITGRVGRIQFSPGNYVTRGETLVTIKQMDPIYVRFPLSQYDVNGIFRGPQEIGSVADVRLTLANGRRYRHAGKVSIVDNVLTGDSDTYTLWAEFPNPELSLTPKGIGALHVGLSDTREVCMVPLTAVHYDANGAFVYTVAAQDKTTAPDGTSKATGAVSRTDVTVGSVQGRLQAVYTGLEEGQIVITDGAHKVRSGDTVIGLYAVHRDTKDQSDTKLQPEVAIPVTYQAVTSMQDPTVLTCHGARVEAINRVSLRPLVQGVLLEQNFHDGEFIDKATKEYLFKIDPTRYEATVKAVEAQIARLNVTIADAQRKYDRQLELQQRNATSLDEVESAKAQLDEQIAQKKSAEAQLVLAKDDLSRCTIKVPMSGRIGRVLFSKGNYIADIKAPLGTLVQLSPIYVRFFLSENEILSAYGSDEKLKKEAEVTLITAKGSEHPEKGTIHFCDNIIKTATDTQNLWASFDNANNGLQPGGVVTIKVRRKPEFKVPAVCSDAIQTDTGGRFVYVIRHNRAVMTRVLCGTPDVEKKLTPIFAGLQEGDKVITGPLAEMEDGILIQESNGAN